MSEIRLRRVIPTDPALTQVRQLRYDVLMNGQFNATDKSPSSVDTDPGTINMAVFNGDIVIACARIEPVIDLPTRYQVSRMVTSTGYQGKGYGKMVLSAAEVEAIEDGAQEFVLDSRPVVEGFYRKLGYQRFEAAKPHKPGEIPMIKSLLPENN